jgi:formate-dependent nitrite reductase cytochrome c552 subunit
VRFAEGETPRGDGETRSRQKRKIRAGAAVVLTFDVLRPEHAACRASFVRHKARLVREIGERRVWNGTWRSLALAVLGNLG